MKQSIINSLLLTLFFFSCRPERYKYFAPPVHTITQHLKGHYKGYVTGGDVPGGRLENYELDITIIDDSTVQVNADHFNSALFKLQPGLDSNSIVGLNDSFYIAYEIRFEEILIEKKQLLRFSFHGNN